MNLPAIKAAAQAVIDAREAAREPRSDPNRYPRSRIAFHAFLMPEVVLEMATALESVRIELHELEEWMKCHTVPESLKVIAGLIRAAIGEGGQ